MDWLSNLIFRIGELLGAESIKRGFDALCRRFSRKPPLLREQEPFKLWKGNWFSYHFTELPAVDGTNAARRTVSMHRYTFYDPETTEGRYHGEVIDSILGNHDPSTYRFTVKPIPDGYLFEMEDTRIDKSWKVHVEAYPDPFSPTGELKVNPVAGCIIGMTVDDRPFASSIVLSRERPSEVDWSDSETVERYILGTKGIILHDLYDHSEHLRYESVAGRIWKSLEQGDHSGMPRDATENEVDKIIDLYVGSSKEMTRKIIDLVLNPKMPSYVTQYWACHLHGTSNYETLRATLQKRKEIEMVISTNQDTYTAFQLLRAWNNHRVDHDEEFLIEVLANRGRSPMVRGLAYVFAKQRTLTDAQKHRINGHYAGFKESLIQDLKGNLRSSREREKYMACWLAIHFPMFDLAVELSSLKTNKVRFVREAAMLAMIARNGKY